MPWMTENSHEHNPNRNVSKDILYVSRGQRLVEPDKFGEWKELVSTCSSKELDRDVEFGLALDALEMMKLGITVSETAGIFADSVDREVGFKRISPVQGCIARDLVTNFGPTELNFGDMIPSTSFLSTARGKEKTPQNG